MSGENMTEKVSVNINTSTLSEIDLLVDNGYYSNRSDFINQAVREALGAQQQTISRIVAQQEDASRRNEKQWFLGLFGITAGEVEAMHRDGETMDVTGYGMLIVSDDVDREKFYAVVRSIHVRGRVNAPKDIRDHYGLK